MRKSLLIVLVTLVLTKVSDAANAACPTFHNFTNGTTADAVAVMDNYNYILQCPNFTGAVGIGMTASNVLDITQNQDAVSYVSLLNTNAGTHAQSVLALKNGTETFNVGQLGHSFGSVGVYQAGYGYLNASTGLALNAGSAPILFGIGSSEIARFTTGGDLLLGTSSTIGSAETLQVLAINPTNSAALFKQTVATTPAVSVWNSATSGDNVLFSFYTDAGSVRGSITYNRSGGVTAYNTTSDERLKNFSIKQQSYRDAINKMWVGDFIWKKTGSPGFGIRAQQAFQYFPEAIAKPATAAGVWQADYGKLAPLALWGVKDLYKTADDQERKIADMQRDMKVLMAQVVELRHVNDSATAKIGKLRAQLDEIPARAGIQTAQN